MQRLRQILRSKRRTLWLLSLLLILLLAGFIIPVELTTRSQIKGRPVIRFQRTIPLDGWFKEAEPIRAFPSSDDYYWANLFEPTAVKPTLRYKKEFSLEHRLDDQNIQMMVSIALWQSDRAFLILSVEVKPIKAGE